MRSLIRPAVLIAGLGGLASCAPTPSTSGPASTATGSVTWEIVDVGLLVSTDNQRFRWSYVVVLRNTGSIFVDFKQVETSYIPDGAVDAIGANPTVQPFERTLGPGAELRIPVVDDWGWSARGPQFGGAATLDAVTALRRYLGAEATGNAVVVPVRLSLHRGVGRRSRPPRAPDRVPAPERLGAADLPHLSGRWRGSYRPSGSVFDIPLRLTVAPDGAFEGGTNDPVTVEISGRLRIATGWVHMSTGPDSGQLGLYEAGAKQFLAGTVSGTRPGGRTASYAVYLERDAKASPAPPPRAP